MDGWMGGCELDRGLGEGGNRACGPRLAKIEDVLFSVKGRGGGGREEGCLVRLEHGDGLR